jgi:hypothetical protein
LREAGILREEAVTGVDRVGARRQRRPDDLGGVEVGAHGVAALTDLVRLVGLLPVDRVAIFVGKDSDRGDPEFVGRPERANGDLASIGHQDLREHRTTFCFVRQ